MPSPITSLDFDLSNLTGDVCQQITSLLGLSGHLKAWFEWAFDTDGNPTLAFQEAMAIIPTGQCMWRPVSSVPTGWLICNGQAVNRLTYANLFSVIGTKFGAGDTTTTFNVPDIQGRFLLASGNGYSIAETGGEQEVTLAINEIPAHTHSIPLYGGDGTNNSVDRINTTDEVTVVNSGFSTTSAGGGDSHNNIPPYFAGLVLIKT